MLKIFIMDRLFTFKKKTKDLWDMYIFLLGKIESYDEAASLSIEFYVDKVEQLLETIKDFICLKNQDNVAFFVCIRDEYNELAQKYEHFFKQHVNSGKAFEFLYQD